MKHSPNFLTCPAVPELPEPKGKEIKVAEKHADKNEKPNPLAVESQRPHVSRPHKPRWIKKTVILLVIIGLCAIFIPPAVAVGRAAWSGEEAKQALDSLKYRLQIGDYASAADEADRAKSALEDFGSALQGVGFFRDAPLLGTQIRSLQDVAAVGAHSLDSLKDILDVATSLSDALSSSNQAVGQAASAAQLGPFQRWQDLSRTDKRNLLRTLQDSLPDIRLARDKIDMALTLWDAIPKDRMMPALSAAITPIADILPVMRQAMDQSVPLLETMVPLAGYPVSKQYLLILQNSDELRPAGGFIGSIANVTLDGGDVTDFRFDDVYNIDNPVSAVWKETPPEPLSKNLGIKAWYMRDANWSPDFTESAGRVLDFYTRENALQGKTVKPDGVIALEPEFFRELLRLVGPVQIEGKEYNDQNFMDLLEYQVEIGFVQQGTKVENRKDVMGLLGAAILQKIQAMPKSDWPKLLNLVTVALREKQIMVYSQDSDLQALLDRYGWSGRAKPTVCDFLWVVDANLAALKTDGKMIKSASYELDARNPQQPVAKVTLDYQNTTSKITWRYTRYRSYTRVYVPEGSQLISSQGAMQGDLTQTGGKFVAGKVDVMKELGKTVFGAFWSVEPGRKGELSFTYALPQSTVDCLAKDNYVLDWPKQPGTDGTEINVKVQMPSVIKAADPPEPQSQWGDAIYQAQYDLREDRTFKAKY